MTHLINKAVLLLTIITCLALINACKNDDDATRAIPTFDGLTIHVSSNNVVHNYFKPKKANIYTKYKAIYGDWYSNENAIRRDSIDRYLSADTKQEYTEHYFFLEKDDIDKYIQLVKSTRDTVVYNNGIIGAWTEEMIIIDTNDIISPYKEYAAYYGDTTHLTDHTCYYDGLDYEHVCALPVLSIDVNCDKNYDENHPAGSKLNDILYYVQKMDTYNYLKNEVYKNEPLFDGIGSINYFEPRKLSDINNNPIYLMESLYHINFDHEPTTPGTYKFTVKFTFGPDPLTGETVDIAPATVSIDF